MKRKQKKEKTKKKTYTPFPPEQKLRKEDEQMITGEYFLSEQVKDGISKDKKRNEKQQKKQEKLD